MYNYDEIEAKWLRYRKKQRLRLLKIVLPAVSILAAAAGALVWFMLPTADHRAAAVPPVRMQAAHPAATVAPAVPPVSVSTTASAVSVQPLKAVDPAAMPSRKPAPPSVVSTRSGLPKIAPITPASPHATAQPPVFNPILQPRPVATSIPQPSPVVGPKTTLKNSSQPIAIRSTSPSGDILPILEDKFSKSPSYALAISAAKEAYDKGNYAKASEWAMKANDIDRDKSDSWLIYGKAMYKNGQRSQGIKALETYLETSQDSDAKATLDRMRSGSL